MASRIATMQPLDRKSSDRRDSFGARLRHERERRKISIASIANSTKILGALLEGLENDDVSRWPCGFYRRAFLRAYADAIGLDPDATWREFAERFPEPEDSVLVPAVEAHSRGARLRLTLSDRVAWFVGGHVLDRLPPRCAAVAFDLAILGGVAICCFVVLGVFWAPLTLAAVCYYCGGILLLGNVPSVCLFAPATRGVDKGKPGVSPVTPEVPPKAQPQTPHVKPQAKRTAQVERLELARSRSMG